MFAEVRKETHNLSSYQPSQEVINITKEFRDAFGIGVGILNRPHEELNNRSPIARENMDKRSWLSYVDEEVEDPMEAWKWKGTRGMARDRALESHAHLTARLAIPMAMAQNDQQEEDRQMSYAMRDVIEWMARNSEYKKSYVDIMMGILYSPAKFLGAEYVESMTTQKYQDDNGEWQKREVVDQQVSGFRAPVYSVDQILITNLYEQDMQRQHTVIKREYRGYSEMEKLWGWHDNFVYVQPGIKTIYSSEDELFYDVKDDQHKNLVEIATGYCRTTDTEVVFINGIYMGDDDVDINAIRHRDNFDLPKVPITPFGYHRVDENYFYWKSLMNEVGWDNSLLDAMYENTMNRETIDLYTPLAFYGVDPEAVSTSVVFPGASVAFESENAKVEPLIQKNGNTGYNAIREVEGSIRDKSVSETMSGELPDATQKAYNVATAEQNARTILRGSLRSVSFSVAAYGDLMKDIAIQHLSTAEWDEITGGEMYRTLILKDQMVDGKKTSKKIIFDGKLAGARMTEKERKDAELAMLTEIGWPKNKNHVYHINPALFSRLKYIMYMEPEELVERNSAFESAVAERMYSIARSDPLASGDALLRNMFNANYHGHGDDYMAEEQLQPEMTGAPAKQGAPTKKPSAVPGAPQQPPQLVPG